MSCLRGKILGHVLQFRVPQWGVLGLILMLFAVTYCSSLSGELPGSFARTSLLAIVCAFLKQSVGSSEKMVESSELDMVSQCFSRVSFKVLVW